MKNSSLVLRMGSPHMKHLAKSLISLVSLVESTAEVKRGAFEGQAQIVLSVSLAFLDGTEQKLNETLRVIESSDISTITLSEPMKSWALTQNDRIALTHYQNALARLYCSKRIRSNFHAFLRLIERVVVAPVVGPDPTVSMENSLGRLIPSEQSSEHMRTDLKRILVSRIKNSLNDIPKARNELTASLRSVQGRCVLGV